MRSVQLVFPCGRRRSEMQEARCDDACELPQVCRKMRKIFGDVNVPIVMCTALTAGHSALDECMTAGATDYLLKPYERGKMIEKIEKYCGAKVGAATFFATEEPSTQLTNNNNWTVPSEQACSCGNCARSSGNTSTRRRRCVPG